MVAPGLHDPLDAALAWGRRGEGVAIATVIRTFGSAPRLQGAQLAVRADGAFEGSVSGGCIEGEVVASAQEVIRSGQPRTLEYGVSDAMAWEVGLACGGRLLLSIMPVGSASRLALLERLGEARRAGLPVVLASRIDDGEMALLHPEAGGAEFVGIDLLAAVREAQRRDRPRLVETEAGRIFLNVFNPPLRLVLVGAVHIAQALAPMARQLGYAVTVVDPRTAFATRARFPDTRLFTDWPDDFLKTECPDARTAVVTLTHDPKLDDAALVEALGSPAFYIGSLGSRKTHRARIERLRAAGFGEAALTRIHAPVGLDIGAEEPAEIAVAILAEVTRELRQGDDRS
ncbi:MAG: XdhC family protein [Rhodothalassiaceae bacterium]